MPQAEKPRKEHPMKHDWRDFQVAKTQALRDLDALPWAVENANRVGARLGKAVVLGLLPICFMAWLVTWLHL
jgi:hypothetical protein